MTTWTVGFVEDREPREVEAETRAAAFKKARRRFDGTPNVVKEHIDESEDEEPTYDSSYVQEGGVPP